MAIRKLFAILLATVTYSGCSALSPTLPTVDGKQIYWGDAVDGLRAGLAISWLGHPIILSPPESGQIITCKCFYSFDVFIENQSFKLDQDFAKSASIGIQLSVLNFPNKMQLSNSVKEIYELNLNNKWHNVSANHDELTMYAEDILRNHPEQREFPIHASIDVRLFSGIVLDKNSTVLKAIHLETGLIYIPIITNKSNQLPQ